MDNLHHPSPTFGIIADDLTSAADGRELVLGMRAGGFGARETLCHAVETLRRNAQAKSKEDL